MIPQFRLSYERNRKNHTRSCKRYGTTSSQKRYKKEKLADGPTVRERSYCIWVFRKGRHDGKPIVRKFGNVDSSPRFLRGGLTVKEQRGPLLDRIVGSEDITIVAELPEVNKEDLQLKADNKSLTLESVAGERLYQKKMVCQTKSSLILVGQPTRMECWKFYLKEKVQIDNGVTTSIN